MDDLEKITAKPITWKHDLAMVAKGIFIPLYTFKMWNDDRKRGMTYFSILEPIKMELFKAVGAVAVGSMFYAKYGETIQQYVQC